MRDFVLTFTRQYALNHKGLREKLLKPENKYIKQFNDVYEALNYLLNKLKLNEVQKQRRTIGFKVGQKE